ncbi:LysE family translocator [Siccirubricoccus sp. KC 17139]|uniref:LysE family translocator n=1 Tax=Siccirubricoccus soli TaxID=2899147 RepID=A0ABT1D2S2_9PROT|nr:LysE family translocator [Siccirubricoccus soli]MCO6416223.1 LysE family translocator [Siccirubricoccus soli]MCP2682357.1 LysE family translocator [Siccirubricoccus soli]
MSATGLLLFATAYLAVVILPGPAVTALVARVLARGLGGAPAFIAGCAAGSLLWFAVAAAGLAALAASFAPLFQAVRYAGAAYLLYLAWKLWRSATQPIKAAPQPDGAGRLFLAGLSINLGNPKAVVFFLALLPSVVDMAGLTLTGALELALVIAAIVVAVFAGYAQAASRAQRFFTSPRALRLAKRGSAVAMAGAATSIAAR